MRFEIALFEWPDNPESGGARMLGRTSDEKLVRMVRNRLRKALAADLDRLARVRGERKSRLSLVAEPPSSER